MCLSAPKPPKVPKQAPLPIVKAPPQKPKEIPKEKLIREEGEEAKVTYGAKPSDALLSQRQGGGSVVNLNRDSLNSAGANQQGLGGGTTA